MILYMFIAPGQGQTTPWGQTFDVNSNPLSLCPFVVCVCVCVLCVFSHVYSPRQGQTTHWGQNIYDDRKAFSLCSYVASFKMISSKSDFIYILMILYMYIAPGQRQKTHLGQNSDVNRKP